MTYRPKTLFSLLCPLLLLFSPAEVWGAKVQEACLTGKIGKERVDGDCRCRKKGTCTKVVLPRPKALPKGVPSFIPSVTKNLGRTAQAVFRGEVSLDADLTKRVYGKHTKKIDRLEQVVQRNIARKKGRAYVAKLKRDSKQRLDRFVAQGLGRMSGNQKRRFLSAVGGDFGATTTSRGGVPAKAMKAVAAKGIKVNRWPTPMVSRQGVPIPSGGSKTTSDARIGEYETTENDIITTPEVSLWRVLSGRYIKTAYPDLL